MAVVGEEGKQYGLIIKKKSLPKQQLSIFAGADSDDEEARDERDRAHKEMKQQAVARQQTKMAIDKALAEDPDIFQYDEVYDRMQEDKKEALEPIKEEKKNRQPKYMGQLMKAAARRQINQEKMMERRIERERAAEDDDLGDKDRFVTNAYRERLLERAKMDEQDRIQARLEARYDVTKQGDLSRFYRNVLNLHTRGQSLSGQQETTEDRLELAAKKAIDSIGALQFHSTADAAPHDGHNVAEAHPEDVDSPEETMLQQAKNAIKELRKNRSPSVEIQMDPKRVEGNKKDKEKEKEMEMEKEREKEKTTTTTTTMSTTEEEIKKTEKTGEEVLDTGSYVSAEPVVSVEESDAVRAEATRRQVKESMKKLEEKRRADDLAKKEHMEKLRRLFSSRRNNNTTIDLARQRYMARRGVSIQPAFARDDDDNNDNDNGHGTADGHEANADQLKELVDQLKEPETQQAGKSSPSKEESSPRECRSASKRKHSDRSHRHKKRPSRHPTDDDQQLSD